MPAIADAQPRRLTALCAIDDETSDNEQYGHDQVGADICAQEGETRTPTSPPASQKEVAGYCYRPGYEDDQCQVGRGLLDATDGAVPPDELREHEPSTEPREQLEPWRHLA